MPDRLCRDIVDFCNKHHTTCRETRFHPKSIIIEESATAHYTFLVRHGTVKLSKSMPNGRSQIVGFVGSGHTWAPVRRTCTCSRQRRSPMSRSTG
ncbi:cyclic nucleotide-binding domain-containing protein [Novacetimonas hansenii]|uniref:cyclic nucleotide-binding domain-containing protein n=1 Tax=Novacetimonas hansenii TaxID=436 RepID=UPI0038D0D436